jgi:hypothetical protein
VVPQRRLDVPCLALAFVDDRSTAAVAMYTSPRTMGVGAMAVIACSCWVVVVMVMFSDGHYLLVVVIPLRAARAAETHLEIEAGCDRL